MADDQKNVRVEVICPFCQHCESEIVSDADNVFFNARKRLKARVGKHIIVLHPDRIFEIAEVMTGPLQKFISARIDGTRKEGRSLTTLQSAANELTLP